MHGFCLPSVLHLLAALFSVLLTYIFCFFFFFFDPVEICFMVRQLLSLLSLEWWLSMWLSGSMVVSGAVADQRPDKKLRELPWRTSCPSLFFWWTERSLVCVLWGQPDWKLSCWLNTVGVHIPLLLFLWIQKRISLYFVCVFRVRQGCSCKGSPCWELRLFLSAGCRNVYSYLCKIWAFVSKVFLQWNLPSFFDVICIWSQFPCRSRASELS